MRFAVDQLDPHGTARGGRMVLGGTELRTPVFMPVATSASLKGLWPDDLDSLGYRIVLSNTYHLYVRPGIPRIRQAGGLHRFMAWDGAILTDSGGFQVFSLATLRKVEEGGVRFRSHLDGAPLLFTPAGVVASQLGLGSDILMPLDVCTEAAAGRGEAERAAELTYRWAAASRAEWLAARDSAADGRQVGSLFGIVQGHFHADLRRRSADQLGSLDLPGYAVGGLSVGESRARFLEFLALSVQLLPADRPRYVMGVGSPDYAIEAVAAGADMFDCVYPTRVARNARALTLSGPLSLRTAGAGASDEPIESACGCRVCRRFSRGYLRHLFNQREIMAAVLTTYHNLAFMARLMEDTRAAIGNGTFAAFRRRFLADYLREDDHG
ncbi:MAG: tRNA guanosine(34) transglycosylase Tgt [Spirochaetaceae bacterium]|nr:tRNA guanosine(34) transglycosylase Tgt [Spirochaetaceae bacterium]